MTTKERKAKVSHANLFGLREEKYAWLSEHDWETTDWQKARPRSEFYLFVPRDEAALERYQKFIKVTDIFPANSTGVTTHRDHFVLDFNKDSLERRIRTFLDQSLPDDFVREALKLKESWTWSLQQARKTVFGDKRWKMRIIRCLYRPFDVRWLFYHPGVIERDRTEIMRHCIVGPNVGLVFGRQVTRPPYTHAFVSEYVIEKKAGSHDRNTYFAPLYLYADRKSGGFFSAAEKQKQEARPNCNGNLLNFLNAVYAEPAVPKQLLGYVYALLYSTVYRSKYIEFLQIDFPRIPFTMDINLFQKLAALGEQLVDLHLLRSSELDPPIARFQGDGDNRVQNGKKGLRYDPNAQRVYINQAQFFEGVPPEVWEYQIGGYQVCHKWLKDRKDRCVSLEEIKTYCRIVTALSKTIEIQADIDKLYPQVEKTLLPIQL